ncbi:MAG: trehalose-phosphatase [Cyanobacteria bacterium]|nr:trehalose-phosphatase [Cyanobacteriota bacterium]
MEHTKRNILKDIDNLLKYLASFDKIFIFSDFDGTLVRFRKNPHDVRLSKKAFYVLENISKNLKIITGIVSGRKISELEFFLGNHFSENFNLFGCHGSEIKFKGANIKIATEALESRESIKLIQDIIEKKFINIDSFIFEEKEKSFAVNYRNTKYSEKKKIEDMKNTFLEFEKKYPVKLLDLKKVFEIVPYNINKSIAIKATMKKYYKMLKENNYIFLCIGDDITDENLFMENISGINIKVGSDNLDNTFAQFFLSNIKEVFIFLNKISCICS